MPFTTDPGQKLGAIRAALVEDFGAVEDFEVVGFDPGIEGAVLDKRLGVGECRGRSTSIDQSGHQIGRRDWDTEWTVRFYVHIEGDGGRAAAIADKAMGQAINALDSDHTLNGEAREASITDWSINPSDPNEHAKRMLIGELVVSVLHLMPDPEHTP